MKYTINDLPKFSPWPARLIGIEPMEQKHKTPEEIMREYEHEKWGPLLENIRELKRDVSIEEVAKLALKDVRPSLCSIADHFELLDPIDARQKYLKLVESTLRPYLPASALVELGAGYGSVILALAKREKFNQMRIMAGEYSASGVELIKRIAVFHRIDIEAEHCDFNLPTITNLAIPANALIFTSMATPYVSKLSVDFVRSLLAYHPKRVIHIEPCFEHCNTDTLIGILRRRYIEVNDYNINLVTLLHDQQSKGLIRIIEERPAVLGPNALLPVSVIVWEPQ